MSGPHALELSLSHLPRDIAVVTHGVKYSRFRLPAAAGQRTEMRSVNRARTNRKKLAALMCELKDHPRSARDRQRRKSHIENHVRSSRGNNADMKVYMRRGGSEDIQEFYTVHTVQFHLITHFSTNKIHTFCYTIQLVDTIKLIQHVSVLQ